MLVAIVTPTIAPREKYLKRALASVDAQETDPGVEVAAFAQLDRKREGAWATRNKGTRRALKHRPDWVGFLDDDDELLPWHVQHLLDVAAAHEADMVWGWFQIVYGGDRIQPEGVGDPFAAIVGPDGTPGYRGRQYDTALPHIVPITYLVRGEVLAEAMDLCGGFQADTIGSWDLQDQPLIDSIHHVCEGRTRADKRTTWFWHHHGANTSGMPDR